MSVAYIYCLSHPVTGAIRYIGKTVNLKQRFYRHVQGECDSHRSRWVNVLKKDGLRPKMEILEEVVYEDEKEWEIAERFWISYLRFIGCDLTNGNSGGMGGRIPTHETRKKQSLAHIGKKLTLEHREKIRERSKFYGISEKCRMAARSARRGMKISEDHKRKLLESNLGVKLTDEHKRKISESIKSSNAHKLAMAKRKGTAWTENRRRSYLNSKRRSDIAWEIHAKHMEEIS